LFKKILFNNLYIKLMEQEEPSQKISITFKRMSALQTLIKKESALKELCKINIYFIIKKFLILNYSC